MSGAGGDAAGNYKGVMLCNRPMEVAGAQKSGPGAANLNPQLDAPRFRPVGLPMEQIGLNPAKENVVCNVLALQKQAAERRAERPEMPGPENYMVKHRKWCAPPSHMWLRGSAPCPSAAPSRRVAEGSTHRFSPAQAQRHGQEEGGPQP